MQSSRLFSCFSFFDLNISDIKVCLHCRFSSVKAWKLTGDGWKFKAPWKCFWVVCLEIPDNVAGCCAWLSWSGPGLQLLNNNLRSLWFVNTEISSSRRLGWAWSKCWSGRKSCNQESRFWFYSDCFEKLTNAKPIWWGEARLARLPLHKHLLQYYRGVSSILSHPPGARSQEDVVMVGETFKCYWLFCEDRGMGNGDSVMGDWTVFVSLECSSNFSTS